MSLQCIYSSYGQILSDSTSYMIHMLLVLVALMILKCRTRRCTRYFLIFYLSYITLLLTLFTIFQCIAERSWQIVHKMSFALISMILQELVLNPTIKFIMGRIKRSMTIFILKSYFEPRMGDYSSSIKNFLIRLVSILLGFALGFVFDMISLDIFLRSAMLGMLVPVTLQFCIRFVHLIPVYVIMFLFGWQIVNRMCPTLSVMLRELILSLTIKFSMGRMKSCVAKFIYKSFFEPRMVGYSSSLPNFLLKLVGFFLRSTIDFVFKVVRLDLFMRLTLRVVVPVAFQFGLRFHRLSIPLIIVILLLGFIQGFSIKLFL